MENLAGAVDVLASALINSHQIGNITAALEQTQKFTDTDYLDLYDLAEKIQANVSSADCVLAAEEVKTAVVNAVVSSASGFGQTGVHGISIYYPNTTYMSTYNNLAFASHNWDEFLRWTFNYTFPSVVTQPASDVRYRTAILNGNLSGKGSAENVTVYFEYGIASYTNTTALQITNATGDFSDSLTALAPNTTYHFRAVAAGDGAPVYGSDLTFMTLAPVTVTVDAPAQVSPNTDFTVGINISDVKGLGAANYNVTFDSAVLQLDNVTDGSINGTAFPVDTWNENGGNGIYTIVQYIPGLSGLNGNGTLAVLHFSSIGASGTSSAISLSDGTLATGAVAATGIPANWVNGTVSITTQTPSVTVTVNAPTKVPSNYNFTVSIDISNVTNLNAANYSITFNSTVLRLDSVTPGSINGVTFPNFIWNSANNAIVQYMPGIDSVSGNGTLAILNFHSIGSIGSSSAISLTEGILSDGSSDAIPATWIADSVLISVIPGDANGDGRVNSQDITKIARMIVGLDAPSLGADANLDGRLNSQDITKTARIIVGLP